MARIPLLEPSATSPEVQPIFAEIKNTLGYIPNLFRAYAQHPPLLEANWYKVKQVMMAGGLSRKTKEAIALLVSKDNGCSYCVAAHKGALQSLAIKDEEIQAIEACVEQANFTPREKALIHLARQSNSQPLTVADKTFQEVRQAGASDADIVEALGVMELFTAFNKFLDSLQVELD